MYSDAPGTPVRDLLTADEIESPMNKNYAFSPSVNVANVFNNKTAVEDSEDEEDVAAEDDSQIERNVLKFFEHFDAPFFDAPAKKEPRMPKKEPRMPKKAEEEKPKKAKKNEEAAFKGVREERAQSVGCALNRAQRYLEKHGQVVMPTNDHLTTGIGEGRARCLERCKNPYCHYRGCLCGPDALWE
jgi:hypothetical protein